MSNFAKIEDNRVTQIVVVPESHIAEAETYLNSLGLEGTWVPAFGKKDAAIGDVYVPSTGNFKPAQPFASWKWNASEWAWLPPKEMPANDKGYRWDEQLTDWVEVI
jgi:hypothetical protein